MQVRKLVTWSLVAATLTACTLYNDVSIAPLIVTPTTIERGSDLQSMVRKSDFLRAIELSDSLTTRQHKTAVDLAALGSAELAAGRYDAARQHLREAVDLEPYHTTLAGIEWNLSEVEYLTNHFQTALSWATLAQAHGLNIRTWHLDYLAALATTHIYRFSGQPYDTIPMRIGRPDVPRVEVRVNGNQHPVSAIIDSGAVLSIISERLADALPVRRVNIQPGTFYGLLGEPIEVHFGIVDRLELGGVVVENVPVAIMPNDKMSFVVSDKRSFSMDFLLGANLLKEFRLEFDFRREQVTFTKLTAADRKPAVDQNLFIDGFRPVVRGTVNKHGWFLFILDTGSEITFLNETQLAQLPTNVLTTKVHSALLQGLGGSRKHGMKMENIEIGVDRWAGTFRNLPMYASGEHERAVGIVGENFMKNFRVVIDFGKMRMELLKS